MVQSSLGGLTSNEVQEFEAEYHHLVEDFIAGSEMRDIPLTLKWIEKVLNYNVPHGKKVRGLMVPMTYKCLVKDPNETEIKLVYVLGWCVEILQASSLVCDDIMDGSITRRGRPCWYKVDNLGAIAFNDSLLLEHIVYRILAKYFKEENYYSQLVDLFLDVTYKATCGQSLDTLTGHHRNLDEYTMERYKAIVKYKTSYYTIFLPIALAMTVIGIKGSQLMEKGEKIAMEIGQYFQVQDDYLDCFGDVKSTGKIGTDIEDCKCTWLFITAKDKCNAVQLTVLRENYGFDDTAKVANVKNLYNELDIQGAYKQYEEESYSSISDKIKKLESSQLEMVFCNLLDMIYKRNK
ncbi:unnamed protein product [Orchesella dallaii]|uniref:Farnesyl pyrophosphate synthase n=1 Tax=Orchesella dallaii TaxID=48710 RepID=A0ABP1S3B9_9HEXA